MTVEAVVVSIIYIISTHTSRVGCDAKSLKAAKTFSISTHTSRVGCDLEFLAMRKKIRISTHTSRVGCDKILRMECSRKYNFYSHIPCGMWQFLLPAFLHRCKFLLTHPVWDVTQSAQAYRAQGAISTHTSRVGCDQFHRRVWRYWLQFLLTHPVWDVTDSRR